ncbi:MAG: glycine--tRNA ligase subunit beta [Thalassospira sp.]|uniref:glycine--tRNA ligase subunit beta n=1 Tax=Thalassospira sp. TaxID=1912094 RepID=UPI001B194971|nr:glycine--tRNA ligase subunit beta [Thalassospira sp.]MBO6577880.1 glycine--tRNA ligase subunit beta [Thalassospira sp.]MBO6802376.1 glycine--tRNA ligase subunit beta [Thalassospira sp.]MBO6816923.1 glycine--tRNA ligase subunit beta [Thalassospira sp.]MBO6889488.1 glycine--tRNA ligase subunit beta [Thalassospira sp.]
MAELLLELFSEEIPARMQARAAEDLTKLVTDGLKAADLGFDKVEALVTPRRLTLIVDGLPEKQPDLREERRGPRADAPEKAINGFLAGNGVTLDQCEKRETPKGVFLFAIVEQKGRAASEVMKDIIEDAMNKLPWPKSMRWADQKIRWVRQLDRILCLFDGKVIPVTYGPVTAGDTTRGHRFLAPAEFSVSNAAEYKEKLRAAKVMLDREERKQVILEGAKKLAVSEGFELLEDNGLLEEVCGLVEWPVPVMGKVDDQFMDIPREVLETSMREHQKYFVVEDKAGKLAARFITVSNMITADKNAKIIAGNERVLRARLHDAKFFWDQDRKVTLQSRLPKLDNIVFHAKLGSLAERVLRLRGLAREVSAEIPGCDVKLADRAAEIGKADLVSQMVFEFTELQGLMGKYYAENDGEAPEVANAIAEHYAPAGPSDMCPTAPVSVALALAEKLDTLAGFFAIDEKPTGSKDPFALRRAALGVIRLVLENGLRLPLRRLFAFAVSQYPATIRRDEAVEDLLAFFADRLKVHLREQGVRHDLVSAVFALDGEDDLVRLLARVEALSDFVSGESGVNLMAGYKRASNILRIEEKKDDTSYKADVSADLLSLEEERKLYEALIDVRHKALPLLRDEDYAAAMTEFARLREPVDAFFEKVTVNSDNADERANRLKLLAQIRTALHDIADFSKIES